jgi:KUP system potassium uptake protein
MPDSHLEEPDSRPKKTLYLKVSLLLSALGVVFGDIGTSPLYALRQCFTGSHGLPLIRDNVLGCVSLIIWFLILLVCIKYVLILMRADNKGEGGVMALMALVDRISPLAKKYTHIISLFGIIGAALLFSDAIITPAISVLGALEGLTLVAPMMSKFIIPCALIIIFLLILIQSKGTARVGVIFGPILFIWFSSIAILGLAAIIKNPDILHAFNPYFGMKMLFSNSHEALIILSTVFLSVTGAEVLYADMGHFGRSPIRTAWFYFVFPSLVLNYLGQGAYLISHNVVDNSLFYRLAPTWFGIPLLIIATFSAAIASQAVITGIFSLIRQAVQLGFLPRLKIVHTSAHTIGQVFVPSINTILCILIMSFIIIYKESGTLAYAYGIAVAATMLLTSILALFVARQIWNAPRFLIISVGSFFIALSAILLIANLLKLVSGGWIVVLIAIILSSMMATWVRGRKMLAQKFTSETVPTNIFVQDIINLKPIRVKGIAVFLSANAGGTPRSLLHNYKHNKVLHETTLLVAIQNQDVPTVPSTEKTTVTELGEGMFQILLKFGFMETPNVPRALSKITLPGIHFDHTQVTYFLGKERLVVSKKRTMFIWQKRLFQFLAHNSLDATTFFNLPSNRVVELGMQVDL